jgi:hypothetical protein
MKLLRWDADWHFDFMGDATLLPERLPLYLIARIEGYFARRTLRSCYRSNQPFPTAINSSGNTLIDVVSNGAGESDYLRTIACSRFRVL